MEGLAEKLTVEARSEAEWVSHSDLWKKLLGKRNSKSKGSEAGARLGRSRITKEASLVTVK